MIARRCQGNGRFRTALQLEINKLLKTHLHPEPVFGKGGVQQQVSFGFYLKYWLRPEVDIARLPATRLITGSRMHSRKVRGWF